MPKDTTKAIVFFDTNFLIIPSKFKVDIFAACERLFIGKQLRMATVDKIVDELKGIAAKRTKDSMDARVALKLIQAKGIEIIATDDLEYADNSLVNIEDFLPGYDGEIYVCTMDAELRRRLRENNINLISLRRKSMLQILN
jgi:rRNA-processing protein FCF1